MPKYKTVDHNQLKEKVEDAKQSASKLNALVIVIDNAINANKSLGNKPFSVEFLKELVDARDQMWACYGKFNNTVDNAYYQTLKTNPPTLQKTFVRPLVSRAVTEQIQKDKEKQKEKEKEKEKEMVAIKKPAEYETLQKEIQARAVKTFKQLQEQKTKEGSSPKQQQQQEQQQQEQQEKPVETTSPIVVKPPASKKRKTADSTPSSKKKKKSEKPSAEKTTEKKLPKSGWYMFNRKALDKDPSLSSVESLASLSKRDITPITVDVATIMEYKQDITIVPTDILEPINMITGRYLNARESPFLFFSTIDAPNDVFFMSSKTGEWECLFLHRYGTKENPQKMPFPDCVNFFVFKSSINRFNIGSAFKTIKGVAIVTEKLGPFVKLSGDYIKPDWNVWIHECSSTIVEVNILIPPLQNQPQQQQQQQEETVGFSDVPNTPDPPMIEAEEPNPLF